MDAIRPWAEHYLGQRQAYANAVLAAGGLPMMLPITDDHATIRQLADTFDGFIFAGGEDIDPSCYGEANTHSSDMDHARDEFELRLIDYVEQAGRPILGVCRGMQMLNLARGGSLHQDIGTHVPGAGNHRLSSDLEDPAAIVHGINIAEGSLLHRVMNLETIEVNSRHHQAVHRLGHGLSVSAWAHDGVVEAVEDLERDFFMGIQWHPESLHELVDPRWATLFEHFVAAARRWTKQGVPEYATETAPRSATWG